MKKVLTEVKTFKAQAYCDNDNTELTFTGNVLTSNPLQYVHTCPSCGETYWLDKSYPSVEYTYEK